MSEDFGSYLKHERELRGIPLDEVALTTKISIRFLQALEDNRFDELPGEVFIRGFIRSYGKAIGSNSDELLAAYHEATGKRPESATPDFASADPPPVSEKKFGGLLDSQRKAILGFGVALVIIIGGVLWVTFQKDDSPSEDFQQTRTVAPTEIDNTLPQVSDQTESTILEEDNGSPAEEATPDPSSASRKTVDSAEPTVKGTPSESPTEAIREGASDKNTVTVPEKDDIIKDLQDQSVPVTQEVSTQDPLADQPLILMIRVDENSWFNLTVDDNRDQDFILPSGGSKTIEAEKVIVMTIGNRRATQLTLNDQPLEIPESPDNVIRNLIVNSELLN